MRILGISGSLRARLPQHAAPPRRQALLPEGAELVLLDRPRATIPAYDEDLRDRARAAPR